MGTDILKRKEKTVYSRGNSTFQRKCISYLFSYDNGLGVCILCPLAPIPKHKANEQKVKARYLQIHATN